MFPEIPLSPAGKMMKNTILSVAWTDEPFSDDLPQGLNLEDINFLHTLATQGDKRAVPEIKKFLARFPQYPLLLNYLRVAYKAGKQQRQADEVLKQLASKHPDYLFTRVGLAMQALESKQTEKAAAVLGPELDIRRLYPERSLFHVSEMRNYYTLAGIIHARRGDPDLAQGVQAAVQEIDPHPEVLAVLTHEIMLANLDSIKARTEADNKRRISVKTAPLPKKIVMPGKPVFQHDEIYDLYEYSGDLPLDKIRKILALPRPTLVEDLMRVLEDCIIRTPNFMKQQVGEAADQAPDHALKLLAELEATEALESVLRFFSLHPEALEFWLGFDTYSPQLSRIIAADIPRCTEWLKSPAIARRNKGILAESMEHLARVDPSQMDEIVRAMEEVLEFLLESPPSANILDTGFLSLLVCCIIELRAERLLPLVETAYRKNLIEEYMVGSLESAITDISAPPGRTPVKFSIEASYRRHQNKGKSDARDLPEWPREALPEVAAPVAGRNDPCSCGSGRKYKKCCMH